MYPYRRRVPRTPYAPPPEYLQGILRGMLLEMKLLPDNKGESWLYDGDPQGLRGPATPQSVAVGRGLVQFILGKALEGEINPHTGRPTVGPEFGQILTGQAPLPQHTLTGTRDASTTVNPDDDGWLDIPGVGQSSGGSVAGIGTAVESAASSPAVQQGMMDAFLYALGI